MFIGWFIQKRAKDSKNTNYMQNTLNEFNIQTDFDAVDNQTLHDNLYELTKIPHLAGDNRDFELAEFIKQKFIDYGLDHAEVNC